jgi:hypothetical protein
MPKKAAQPSIKPKARKPRSKKTHPKRPAPAVPVPSWIRPEVTRRRAKMGRPPKLTPPFIERFLRHVRTGVHLSACAALEGVSPQMISAWLRQGKDDEEKGRTTIHRDFSSQVRAALADLQQQGVTTLLVYQRMAEGWDPYCATCKRRQKPCGRHKRQLKLAADLQRWILSHRFPREWAPGTMPALLAGDQDGAAMVASSGGDSIPAPTAFGAIVFLPSRAPDDLD